MRIRTLTAAGAIMLGAALLPATAASAMTPGGHSVPSTCGGPNKPYDSYGTSSATISVFKNPGRTKIGTLPKGNWFCYHSSSGTFVGDTYYVQGYGYSSSGNNGSKVSGWINDYYVAG